ncbi:MAG: cyclic nucleotide-binding domain-containing protein [Desulfobacterales bacterium]|jgi:CRP-like cAMP-binding protein|nr:MAG: cyclic nucleotide-binding domain-containing protein [Desulfobacterales bacterium]
MYLKQSDLFTGLGHNFLKETMAIAEKVPFDKGEFVFREGEAANCFFILIRGQISLILGDPGKVVYMSVGIGEIFGCSSLIGRDTYFLSAKCEEPSVLLSIDQQKMQKILSDDVENGFIFFKQLAGALGNRLMQMYQQFSQKAHIAVPD